MADRVKEIEEDKISSDAKQLSGSSPTSSSPDSINEKVTYVADVEKSSSASSTSQSWPSEMVIHPGRPEIETLIKSYVANVTDGERTIVSACGPIEMMEVARKTVTGILGSGKGTGNDLELHIEQFGW